MANGKGIKGWREEGGEGDAKRNQMFLVHVPPTPYNKSIHNAL